MKRHITVIGAALALSACTGGGAALPQLVTGTGTTHEVLATGTLVVDGKNCVSLKNEQDTVESLTWPKGYSVKHDGDRVAIVDQKGTVVAHIGDKVHLSGGVETVTDATPGCPGATSTMVVNDIEPPQDQ